MADDLTYKDINSAVNEYFFNTKNRLLPVYLMLEEDAAKDISTRLGIDASSLESVIGRTVAQSLNFEQRGSLYASHEQELQRWWNSDPTINNSLKPPFTALLCCLSLAASRMSSESDIDPNNYYKRLFSLWDISSKSSQENKTKNNAKKTLSFWNSLNRWLQLTDYEFGYPTATQVKSWRYVSYALSQALVRDADKAVIAKMFKRIGKAYGDELSDSETMLHLHEWMRSSEPSQWLRYLWDSPNTRERLVSIVQATFSSWEPPLLEAQTRSDKQLRWYLTLNTRAGRKTLRLFLGVGQTFEEPVPLKVCSTEPDTIKAAFADTEDELRIEPLLGFFGCLEPIDRMNLGQLLYERASLESADGTLQLKTIPRKIIPFVKSTSNPSYREISRLTIFQKAFLLCHGNYVDTVLAYLKEAAREGFKEHGSNQLNGVPEGWYLITDVELVVQIPEKNQDMQSIVPIPTKVTIECSKGLNLGYSLWHAKAPPILSVASEAKELNVSVRHVSKIMLDDSSQGVIVERHTETGLIEIQLSDNLQSKTTANVSLLIEVSQDNDVPVERRISLRDATTPRPIQHEWIYAIDCDDAFTALNSPPIDTELQDVLLVQGMRVSGQSWTRKAMGGQLAENEIRIQELDLGSQVSESNGKFEKIDRWAMPQEFTTSCLVRNHHHSIAQPSDAETFNHYDPVLFECKDCGLRAWERPMRWYIKHQEKTKNISYTKQRENLLPASPTASTVEPDLLLDSLCYLGGGNINDINRLVSQWSDNQTMQYRFVQDLTSLGHIDLHLSTALRPKHWSIAPPVLCKALDGSCFFSGYRNEELIRTLNAVLQDLGWHFQSHKQKEAVSVLRWTGGLEDNIAKRLEDIEDPFGRMVEFSSGAALTMAIELPSLGNLCDALESIHVGSVTDLQRFNLSAGRWEACDSSEEIGAYRLNYAGRTYFVRLKNGKIKQGTAEITKLLAARDQSILLHGYSSERQCFQSIKGAEPPHLYGRALVACSGQLPKTSPLNQHIFEYHSVPPNIAQCVLESLYQ